MKKIESLLNENQFLKTLFESIPCSVMIIDAEQRVELINHTFRNTFSGMERHAKNQLIGEAIRCMNEASHSERCGNSENCLRCELLATAKNALTGQQIRRKRIKLSLGSNGKSEERIFLVSAAPIKYDHTSMAIVIFEDITELYQLKRQYKSSQAFAGIIGQDVKMIELFQAIQDVADVEVPVLIQGESGTGKELVAAAIHKLSSRSNKSFVPVNCGALPENLLESELFGHVKGAFTGAIRDKKGRFEIANGGTIFLDEIAELSMTMQVKLLRVLQEGTFERVGSEVTTKVNVRILSATNRMLREEVEKKRFREDLYYRLCVVPMNIPPLRERRADIPLLVAHILENNLIHTGQKTIQISRRAIDAMLAYAWPGNVRELQNALQFALVKCRGANIDIEHLPPTVVQVEKISANGRIKRRRKRKLNPMQVREALEEANGNKVRAAQMLGVSRATLYRFIEDVGV